MCNTAFPTVHIARPQKKNRDHRTSGRDLHKRMWKKGLSTTGKDGEGSIRQS